MAKKKGGGSPVPKSQKRHGNLGPKASQVYEDIRDEHPNYSKTKAAKIANAQASGTINHRGGGKKSGGKSGWGVTKPRTSGGRKKT